MAQPAGDKSLNLAGVAVFRDGTGVILASTDQDCEFITTLTGDARDKADAALAAAGR